VPDGPDDLKPQSTVATPEDQRTALARLLPAGYLVKGELKTNVTVTVTDITERAAQAQLRVTRARYKEPVQVAMRYSVALPLGVILLLVFGGGALLRLDPKLLLTAILAVAGTAGVVGWKFISKMWQKETGGEPE
jgi:hypothetical protein